jgi:hypothetical protein
MYIKFLCLLFLCSAINASPEDGHIYFGDAGKLLMYCAKSNSGNIYRNVQDMADAEHCNGYIEGIVEGRDQLSFCIPHKHAPTIDQIVGIVRQYILLDPRARNYNAGSTVINALAEVFPCTESSKK